MIIGRRECNSNIIPNLFFTGGWGIIDTSYYPWWAHHNITTLTDILSKTTGSHSLRFGGTYYALEATGDLARLDDAVFDGIHKDHKQLFSEDALAAWAAENGVDAAKFRAAFESPGVSARAMRAEQLSRDYRVNSVPHVVVDGKYIVMGKTHEDTLKIARQLVDKAAAEKKVAKR